MDIATQMSVFVRAVEDGSLSAAARSLGVSPSAVSKQVRRLEEHLHVRLLKRSSRRVSLTEEGRVLYRQCAQIAAAIEETEAIAASMTGQVSGTLNVVSTVAFGKSQLLPLLSQFMAEYPDLELSLELSDRAVDFHEENIDIGIRFTEQLGDDTLIARQLAPNHRIVVAAPQYVTTRGCPHTPQDLYEHNCLRLATVSKWNSWAFGGAWKGESVNVSGNFEANSADAVYHATLAGVGVARLSTYLVADDLREGRLVQLLQEFPPLSEANIYAVYADRRYLSPKVRALIDFLVERLGPVPPWERA